MKKGCNNGLGKYIDERREVVVSTLNDGIPTSHDCSEKLSTNGFYFDTSTIFGWFKKMLTCLKNGETMVLPETLRFLYYQKKYVSFLVKEEIYRILFRNKYNVNDFENIWKEFTTNANFQELDMKNINYNRENYDSNRYDEEHFRLSQKYGLILITNDDNLFVKDNNSLTDIGLLKKIQDLS